MMRRVSMFLLLFFVSSLLLGLGGCLGVDDGSATVTGDQEGAVPSNLRPDKYWGETWNVKDKESILETDAEQAVFNAHCSIDYRGEKPAENVQVIISSPLTSKIMGAHPAESYGTVQPGETIEYRLFVERSGWQELISAGTSAENLKEDFAANSYVEVTWLDSGQEYSARLFDWSEDVQ
ncbi:MAG: hypothetical protein ACOX6Z_02575 [Dethiobacteria bacterium]|jgi:hypothetical protein